METFKINNADFECEFKLKNSDGQEVEFTKSAMIQVTIVQEIFSPFTSGVVGIANPYDFVEEKYFLRGDGRDILTIKFKPKDETNFKDNEFEHEFAIIDEVSSTVNIDTRAEGIKNFTVISKDAIKFTDEIPYGKRYGGKVGDILKEIFKEILGDDKVDEENWASGDFETEYFPPATFRFLDLIHYFLRIFYAKDDGLYVKGFIMYDPKKKKYSLELISKLFKDNKKHEMESFVLGDLTSEVGFENKNNPPPGPPIGGYFGGLRHISYSTPFYTWTSDYFVNSIIIGYDRLLGQHKMRKITFDDIKEKWKKSFVDSFKSVGGKPKPFAIKNNTTDKKFKRFTFPYLVDDGSKIVEAEMVNALTFYNLQLSFINIGSAHRSAGKFIDIATTKKDGADMKSEEKILGRWFVTKVHHVFNNDTYSNTIFATKTYIGPQSNVKDDVE